MTYYETTKNTEDEMTDTPTGHWKMVNGIEVYFDVTGMAVRATIGGACKHPYVWNPRLRAWSNVTGELSIGALRGRMNRGTLTWM